MAKIEAFACDECGAQKKEANHWWLMVRHYGHQNESLALIPWDNQTAGEKSWRHLCGEACVQKAVSKFLNTASAKMNGYVRMGQAIAEKMDREIAIEVSREAVPHV